MSRHCQAPILMQKCRNAPALRTPHAIYANAMGTCAVASPPAFGTNIVAQYSDQTFHALVLSNEIAMVSVYLPDSSKPTFAFELAVSALSAGLDAIRARHRTCGFILAGGFNVKFSSASGVSADIVGPCLWPAGNRPSERLDILLAFCGYQQLVHGPSFVPGPVLERWTREAWGANGARTSLDHVLLSQSLCIVRWSPWPLRTWDRDKRCLWGDHRPMLAIVEAASGRQPLRINMTTVAVAQGMGSVCG